MRTAYIAYPIDYVGADRGWFVDVSLGTQALLEMGVAVYDPGDAWSVPEGLAVGEEIKTVNDAAVDACDGLLAFFPAGVPSVGVPMEVARANQAGKAVAVVSDRQGWSLAGLPVFPWTEDGIEQAARWLAEQPAQGGGGAEGVDGGEELRWAGETFAEPRRAYRDDAGFDLTCTETLEIQPNEFEDIPCGVSVELPNWTWAMLTGRSSTLRKRGLLVSTGIIDCGYRGPLFAGVWNLTDHPVTVEKGDRVAQLIVLANTTRVVQPVQVETLSDHPRGLNGFGSSGA